MPTVSHSDAAVHYGVSGSGPGLVLVHGAGGSGEANFGEIVPKLADRRTVVTPDYSGSGQTTDDGRDLTTEYLAEQVVAAIRDAAVDGPVDLLGFSLGSAVAVYVAAHYPELVRRLVLLGGFAGSDDPRHQLHFDLWLRLEAIDHELFNRYTALAGFSPDFLSAMGTAAIEQAVAETPLQPGIRRQTELARSLDVRDLLPRIGVPTLVIGMTQDQIIPVRHSRDLHHAIGGSEYAELDAGHLVDLERRDELVALVRRFLFSAE